MYEYKKRFTQYPQRPICGHHPNKNPHANAWSELDVSILTKVYHLLTNEEIHRIFPNRTDSAITAKASYLRKRKKIEGSKKFTWTEREESILAKTYHTLDKEELLEVFIDKTWSAITSKASELRRQGLIVGNKEYVFRKTNYTLI